MKRIFRVLLCIAIVFAFGIKTAGVANSEHEKVGCLDVGRIDET